MESQNGLAPLLAKLDRADETMRTFNRELRRASHAHPLRVEIVVDFQSGWSTALVQHAEPIPPRLAVLVGESLYHGRSVLEHLVWALVKANRKKPGKDHTFPIWTKPRRLRDSPSDAHSFKAQTKRRELAGVPAKAVAMIEEAQPYNREHPEWHFLATLNRMARDDRHHALHSAHVGLRERDGAGQPVDIEPVFTPIRGYRITEFESLMRDGKALVRGTRLARWRAMPLTRENKVRVKGEFPSFIAFGNRDSEYIFVQDFKRINEGVRKIVEPFAEFL
jgi:hypothetical protein